MVRRLHYARVPPARPSPNQAGVMYGALGLVVAVMMNLIVPLVVFASLWELPENATVEPTGVWLTPVLLVGTGALLCVVSAILSLRTPTGRAKWPLAVLAIILALTPLPLAALVAFGVTKAHGLSWT